MAGCRRWICRCWRAGIPMRSRIGAARCWSQRCCAGSVRRGGHRTFRIQQVIVARSQPEFDQGARVGHGLRLPAVVGLIAAQGILCGLGPFAGSLAAEIVLANQRFLNGLRAIGVDFLLAARRPHSLLPSRGWTFSGRSGVGRAGRFGVAGCRGRPRFLRAGCGLAGWRLTGCGGARRSLRTGLRRQRCGTRQQERTHRAESQGSSSSPDSFSRYFSQQ